MIQEIKTVPLPLPYKLGVANCYLVKNDASFVLIDTGGSSGRAALEKELAGAGCGPGDLSLIILTHGDFDHTGNSAYLRKKFGAKIAIHRDDSGMVERGDMFWNRKTGNALFTIFASLARMITPLLFGFPRSSRLEPDFYVEDRDDLSEYGFDAQVLSIPGHSKGSIGILTADGDLFCGDLLENNDKPILNSIIDDLATAKASIERLKSLEIRTVYPGHGKPFPMEAFSRSNG